jgi:ankyrin repeat protein
MRAAMNGQSEMVLFLLKNGADGKARDEKGRKALSNLLGGMYCITVEAARALNDQGSYEQAEIQEALLNAVTGPSSCLELVKFFVESGADVNKQNAYGNTALILASMWGHTEAVRFLLSKGADVSIKSKEGNTALDETKDSEIRQLLKDAKRGQQ